MTRQRTSYKRRSGTIPVGDYHSMTRWDKLLGRIKRMMGPSIPSRPINAWYSPTTEPWGKQRDAAMWWLRNVFQAPRLTGISIRDGKRL